MLIDSTVSCRESGMRRESKSSSPTHPAQHSSAGKEQTLRAGEWVQELAHQILGAFAILDTGLWHGALPWACGVEASGEKPEGVTVPLCMGFLDCTLGRGPLGELCVPLCQCLGRRNQSEVCCSES